MDPQNGIYHDIATYVACRPPSLLDHQYVARAIKSVGKGLPIIIQQKAGITTTWKIRPVFI